MSKKSIKKHIGVGIGVMMGLLLFDFFDGGGVAWVKGILAGALTIGFLYLYEKNKK